MVTFGRQQEMRFPKIHRRSRSVEASGQLLTVQAVIRLTKTHPVLPGVFATSVSPRLITNILSFFLWFLAAITPSFPLPPNGPFLNIFLGKAGRRPFNSQIYTASSSFSLCPNWVPQPPGTSAVTLCPLLYRLSCCCCFFPSLCFGPALPPALSAFSHIANEFCGCNETFQCPLRVRGRSASSRVCICVLAETAGQLYAYCK